ncbi:MAG: hypothetical protein WD981_05390 [Gaiellaceae bacterium]
MKRLILLLAFAAVLVGLPGTAGAADGDNLRTIIADRTGTACASYNDAGDHFSVGVGIAFDGTNLLISCYSDNTVTAIDPADGSQVGIHSITGASSLGALAWDNGRGLLWACSAFNQVGTIDLATNAFTYAFTIAGSGVLDKGCFDGLAYDGADDTLWASGDVSRTVEHFSITGTELSSNDIGLGDCNGGYASSGIAVGGPLLYLANNGCAQIYRAPKDFSSESLFATFPARLEDLECDNLTFASIGKDAIWSIDAYDNILNAWEIPAESCIFGGGGEEPNPGFVTGGGSVYTSSGVRVTHGFELHCTATDEPNSLQVNWGKGNKFHLTGLTSASCSDDPAISPEPPAASFDTHRGSGTGKYNGVPGATAEWTLTDAGEPGTSDTMTLTIRDAANVVVLTVSGTLNNGNHQAHDG